MTTQTTLLDLDSLLDQNLAAVEAAPEYVTPDTGNYRLKLAKITVVQREAKDKDKALAEGKPAAWGQMNFDYTIEAIHSVAEGGLPVAAGSLFRESFNITEQGLPYLKGRIVDLVVAQGGAAEDADSLGLRDVMNSFPDLGIEFDCHIKTETKKLDNGNDWTSSRLSQIKAAE